MHRRESKEECECVCVCAICVYVCVASQICLRWMKSAQAFQCYGQLWPSIKWNEEESGHLNPAILETPACLKIQSAYKRPLLRLNSYFSLRAAIPFIIFYYETWSLVCSLMEVHSECISICLRPKLELHIVAFSQGKAKPTVVQKNKRRERKHAETVRYFVRK